MTTDTTGSGMGSVLRDLRSAIGELFTGGKLAKERELPVEVLFSLIGYVAKADSIVTSHEADLVNTLMDEMELPSGGRALANEAFELGRLRKIDVVREAERIKKLYPAGSTALLQWLDILVRVALADGRLFPRERETLETIAAELGFDSEAVRLRLAALGASAP
jgi:DnaJ like chaperone protein